MNICPYPAEKHREIPNIQRPPGHAFAGDINGAKAIGSWLGHDTRGPRNIDASLGYGYCLESKAAACIPKKRGSKDFPKEMLMNFNPLKMAGGLWPLWIPEKFAHTNFKQKSKI